MQRFSQTIFTQGLPAVAVGRRYDVQWLLTSQVATVSSVRGSCYEFNLSSSTGLVGPRLFLRLSLCLAVRVSV